MKKQHIEVLNRINNCPKCNELMERRKHKTINEKQLNRTYYFSEWDYCTNCNHLQHYEEYKVLSQNYKDVGDMFQEIDRQNSFFNNI